MTKKELVANIITLIGAQYGTENQLMRKTKEALESILLVAQNNAVVADESEEQTDVEPMYFPVFGGDPVIVENTWHVVDESKNTTVQHEEQTVAEHNEELLRKFNLEKYTGYTCPEHMRTLGISAGQRNLVKSLEANFKVSINLTDVHSYGDMSAKINRVFEAIRSGKVKARPETEIVKNLENYKAERKVNPASSAQLSYISTLEKELSATDSVVISDTIAASKRIAELLKRKASLSHAEAAVTEHEPMTIVTDMLKKPGFRDRFASMLRRVVSIID